MRNTSIIKVESYSCDECRQTSEGASEDHKKAWLHMSFSDSAGLRLFEDIRDNRYESFNIPNKEEHDFCSKKCAKVFIDRSIDLFLAELAVHSATLPINPDYLKH